VTTWTYPPYGGGEKRSRAAAGMLECSTDGRGDDVEVVALPK